MSHQNGPPAVVAALCAAVLGACAARSVDTAYAREFPALEQGRVLEIQVRREPTTLSFTNTTASDIPPCTMWLNQRFSRPFDGLGVGDSVTLPLSSFVDEFGERFRPGGFWATRPSDRVVLAQFELPGDAPVLLGAVVVNGEENPDARRRRGSQYEVQR